MSAVTIRLSDAFDKKIVRAARRARKNRSEDIRQVLEDSFRRQEQEDYMQGLIRAAKVLATDPAALKEAREIQADFDAVDTSLDSVIAAERAAGIDPDEKWWD